MRVGGKEYEVHSCLHSAGGPSWVLMSMAGKHWLIRPGTVAGLWETTEGEDVELMTEPIVETERQGELFE